MREMYVNISFIGIPCSEHEDHSEEIEWEEYGNWLAESLDSLAYLRPNTQKNIRGRSLLLPRK
ncbi:MAG: hypothetical protein ACI9HK_002350 [Pirellulaceae bacterium]|jgi:hypothetical protein